MLRNDGPAPFLAQLRAHSSLRRELHAIGAQLELHLRDGATPRDRSIGLTILPNRFTARLGAVGVSFSWLPGQTGTVEDGRLLVIEWHGVLGEQPGNGAFTSATPGRQRIYRAEATEAADWHWRDEAPNGHACTTATLVGDCISSARGEAASLRATRN